MTERKPSLGIRNAATLASTDLGRGGRKTPSPSSGSASTQDAPAMWVPGCGGGGCSRACALQEKSPPTRLGRAQAGSVNMQIYVSEHANEHLFFFLFFFFLRQQPGHFFPGDSRGSREHSSSRVGDVGPGRGIGKVPAGTEGKGARLPALPHQPDRMGRGLGGRSPSLRTREATRKRPRLLLLRDLPLLQDDLSLPGRELGLVVA